MQSNDMEWIKFDSSNHHYMSKCEPPFDGQPFLACIWGDWVGLGIYAHHYDSDNRCPGKYEFFYVSENPEEVGWQIRIGEDPFPITYWMPLPKPPGQSC